MKPPEPLSRSPIATPLKLCAAVAVLTLVAGCGKPEDASPYKFSAASSASETGMKEIKTPLPPYPAWSVPIIGRNLKDVAKGGTIVCEGSFDTVTSKHTGARSGVEVEGWGWDKQDAKPLDRVIFVDAGGKVVGAATLGVDRPDVPKAVSDVKTPAVGWKGVVGTTSDRVQAIGLNTADASCVLGETIL